MEDVQIVMTEARGSKTSVHLAIEDASGDSAIIEFVDGEQRVHHGREHVIMTNDPPYDEQIALLAQLDYSNPSSDMPLPGNVRATDRFQRAAYNLGLLLDPDDITLAGDVSAAFTAGEAPF